MSVKRGTLCYPLSAVLILLSVILQDPALPATQDDLRRIGEFVGFLKGRADEGFEVQRLLNACIKLRDVAACALIIPQAEKHPRGTGVLSSGGHTSAQLDVSITDLVIQNHAQIQANNSHLVNPHQAPSRERLAATRTRVFEQPAVAPG